MTTLKETDQKSIFLVTTADTDILTAERAISEMAIPDFPRVVIYNPVALDSTEGQFELLEAAAGAGVHALKLQTYTAGAAGSWGTMTTRQET